MLKIFQLSFLALTLFLFACSSSKDDNTFANNDSTNESTAPQATATPVPSQFSPTVISRFLWKPKSERDGNLVILVDPVGVKIVVNAQSFSEELFDFGPSNGRGTTGRSPNNSGTDFGTAITVEFFDSQGRKIRLNNGNTSVSIPNGADRVEFTV